MVDGGTFRPASGICGTGLVGGCGGTVLGFGEMVVMVNALKQLELRRVMVTGNVGWIGGIFEKYLSNLLLCFILMGSFLFWEYLFLDLVVVVVTGNFGALTGSGIVVIGRGVLCVVVRVMCSGVAVCVGCDIVCGVVGGSGVCETQTSS